MTIVSLTIARPAVMTEGGGFVPSAVAVAAPYAPRGPIIAGTSDTAVTLISTGAASWVLNEPSLEFHEGARMRASVIGATNIWMEGLVLSYVPDTRLLTLGIDLSSGTGATFDEWTLNVAGQPGTAGPSGPPGRSRRPDRSDRTNGHARPARHQRRDRSIGANRTIRHAGHSWRRERSDWSVWCSRAPLALPARPAQAVRSARPVAR